MKSVKNKSIKMILSMFIIILIINSFFISIVEATSLTPEIINGTVQGTENIDIAIGADGSGEPKFDPLGSIADLITGLLGKVVGALTYPIRGIALLLGKGVNKLTASLAYIEGTTDPKDPNISTKVITPFDIFFNKVALFDINFFKIENLSKDSLIYKYRTGIATWYYVLRGISLSMLLVVLIYVGINMAFTTIASEKAKFKKMLIDWITSVCLLFLTAFIISFIISLNATIINAIEQFCDSTVINDTYTQLEIIAYKVWDLNSIPATIIYGILVFQTLALCISYFFRMLKLAFLVLISPLITITYSIDKISDGKAQALGAWLKEFVFTVLIQPFHCIIYMVFIKMAFSILLQKQQLQLDREAIAAGVIAMLCILFVKDAEKLVKRIFSFQDDGSGTSILTGTAVAALALNKAKSIGKATKTGFNTTKSAFGTVKDSIHNMGNKMPHPINSLSSAHRTSRDMAILSSLVADEKKSNPEITDEQAQKNANDKMQEIMAARIAKKSTRFTMRPKKKNELKDTMQNEFKKRFDTYKEMVKDEMPEDLKATYSDAALESMAANEAIKRINKEAKKTAKQVKRDRRSIKRAKRSDAISKNRVLSAPKKLKEIYRQSSVAQDATHLTKSIVSSGFGLALGSGVMGITSNNEFSTGIMAGISAKKGSKEFLETTSNNMFNKINNSLRQTGVNDQREAAFKTNEIVSKYEGDEGVLEFKQYCKELEDALEAMDKKDALSAIQGTLKRGIKADATKTQQIIRQALLNEGIDPTLKTPGTERVLQAATKVATSLNEQEVYNLFKSGAAMGYSFDYTAKKANKTFDSNRRDYTSDMDEPENRARIQAIQNDLEINDDVDLQAFIDQIEAETMEITQAYEAELLKLNSGESLDDEEKQKVIEDFELVKAEILANVVMDLENITVDDIKNISELNVDFGVNSHTLGTQRINKIFENASKVAERRADRAGSDIEEANKNKKIEERYQAINNKMNELLSKKD